MVTAVTITDMRAQHEWAVERSHRRIYCALDLFLKDQDFVRFLTAFFHQHGVDKIAPGAFQELKQPRRRYEAVSRIVSMTGPDAFCDFAREAFPVAPPKFGHTGMKPEDLHQGLHRDHEPRVFSQVLPKSVVFAPIFDTDLL